MLSWRLAFRLTCLYGSISLVRIHFFWVGRERMDILFKALMFVLAIGILVAVHEYGHYWVARRFGVKVLKFSIGFGPSLYSWRRGTDNTEYVIAAIPLGGYVKMLGEQPDEPVPVKDHHRSFDRKPPSQRFAIAFAGPAFNLIFAVLVYAVMYMIGVPGIAPVVGEVTPNSIAAKAGMRALERVIEVEGDPVDSWQDISMVLMARAIARENTTLVTSSNGRRHAYVLSFEGLKKDDVNASLIEKSVGISPYTPVVVGEILPNSAAAAAKLQKGDRIIAINDVPIHTWGRFVTSVQGSPNKPLRFQIERAGQAMQIGVTPAAEKQADGQVIGRIGMGPAPLVEQLLVTERSNPLEALWKGTTETARISAMTVSMLWQMLKGLVSTDNLGGPITIAQFAGDSASLGLVPFLSFLAMISISLGVLNLFPIPVLDGGHLLFCVVEMIKGSPVSAAIMARAQQVGVFLLVMLMSFAFYNDIVRLLK